MSFRDWLPFHRKDNPVANIITLGLWGSGQIITPKTNLAKQAAEGYQQNVTVFDCVNLLARSCAGIPWVLMQRGSSAGSKPKKLMSFRTAAKALNSGYALKAQAARQSEIEDHPLLGLLERPNPSQGGPEYTENVFGYFLIAGNSFETWVTPDTGPNKGKPLELWCLRPDRMRVIGGLVGTSQIIARFEYWVGSEREPFPLEGVLHQKFFAPLDDYYGLSPIQVAGRIIDGDNAAVRWNQNLLANSARPPGALVIKGGLQDDARDRMKAELKQRIVGAANAGSPMVFEGDVDWKTFSINPADLDWLEGRKLNRREIARAYNVPPELIGDTDVQGYASKEQARRALYEETVLPLMDRRRDNLNNAVTPLYGSGLYLDYDRDQIEALHDDMAKKYAGLRQADWLSANEKRAATGYDDYEGDPVADKPAEVPTMFLKPAAVPGAPEDTGNPGDGRVGTTDPETGLPADAAALKAVRISDAARRKHEERLAAKWSKRLARQKRGMLAAIDKQAS